MYSISSLSAFPPVAAIFFLGAVVSLVGSHFQARFTWSDGSGTNLLAWGEYSTVVFPQLPVFPFKQFQKRQQPWMLMLLMH